MTAAATSSSQRVDFAQGTLPSASLQRSQSASSSSTAHPLDSSESKEEKAPSSTSSSPTFQSTSSSSNHKTISTAVSSVTTASSLSPPRNQLQGYHKDQSSKVARNLTNDSGVSYAQTSSSGYSWDSSRSNKNAQGQSPSEQQLYPTRGTGEQSWSYDRFPNEDGSYSPVVDEDTPMQYPPISEEDKEARAVELNLERWASLERQRRKALRASRTASVIVPPAPTNKLTKRLSGLNILSPKGNALAVHSRDFGMERGSVNRNNSEGSVVSYSTVGRGEHASGREEGLAEGSDDRSILLDKRLEKGKRKEGSGSSQDPFRDPSSSSPSNMPMRQKSVKPTPRAPIVTPGKAPTIRHRAMANALESGGIVRVPSIVATDADEEREAVRQIQELVIDPFQSAAEMEQRKQYIHAREAARRTLLEGDEGANIIAGPRPVAVPNRKSTSSSKFNEIGLDDEESESGMARPQDTIDSDHHVQADNRSAGRPWWATLFCGCGDRQEDEDEEQSGRTFPE